MMLAGQRWRQLRADPLLLPVLWMAMAGLPKDLGAQTVGNRNLPPITSTNTTTSSNNIKASCSSLPSLPHSGAVVTVVPARQSSPDSPSPAASRDSSSPEAGSSASRRLPPTPMGALNCSDSDRLVAVRVRVRAKRRTARASIFLCPAVKVLRLQVEGHRSRFLHVTAQGRAKVTSCSRANDTWLMMTKGRHRAHLMLRFEVATRCSSRSELKYSYGVHGDPMMKKTVTGKSVHQSARPDRRDDDHHSVERAVRWKRSTADHGASGDPLLNSTNIVDGDSQSLIGCGQTKTCIRYGWEGCGHLTCDYMLSYRVLGNMEIADIEISARSTGWVAVGFSSDKFMGGDDDVIGCKLKRKLSAEVTSMSLGNTVMHTRPQEKANRLEFLKGQLQNGHIYCHVRRPLKYKKRLANSDLDLVNDWHQLYAFGDIDNAGRIMQHIELPRVSEHKISMIRVTDIMVVTSVALSPPLSASCLLAVLLPLVSVFAGS
ncbi:uncharacterized protein LOC143297090 [Babylonia areolata]|uniref:uncharacterized protein LOC143297090 n=1 Tax=Babylonia areolata TaxID=304850 RepID=UPI003FD68182